MIAMLQLRYSSGKTSARRIANGGGMVVYLALEVNSSRTYQITFVERLLHRRGRLIAHHDLRSGVEERPLNVCAIYVWLCPSTSSTVRVEETFASSIPTR